MRGYYEYSPSVAAAGVACGVFAIPTLAHTFQLIKKRSWFFIPFLIGGYFEVTGYAARAVSAAQNPNYTQIPYIVQSLTILLAPALLAASIYMTLSRIIILTEGAIHAPIRATWLTKIFVCGDVLSFLAQCAGGGILAGSANKTGSDAKDDANLGQNVITAGLGIQVLFFGLFMLTTILFHRRMAKQPTPKAHSLGSLWQKYIYVLYSVSALILVRSLFRIAEYAGGQDGFLLKNEYYSYIFDAAHILVAMVILNFWHPSHIIGGQKKDLGGSDVEVGSETYMELNGRPKPQDLPQYQQ